MDIQPAVRTESVTDDPDDPAIWVHPTDPGRSLIIGTNKVKAPTGAVVVFGLDGKIRQTVAGTRPAQQRRRRVWPDGGRQAHRHRRRDGAAEEPTSRVPESPDGSGIADMTSLGKHRECSPDRSGEQAAPMGDLAVPPPARWRDLRDRRSEERSRAKDISGSTASTTTGRGE